MLYIVSFYTNRKSLLFYQYKEQKKTSYQFIKYQCRVLIAHQIDSWYFLTISHRLKSNFILVIERIVKTHNKTAFAFKTVLFCWIFHHFFFFNWTFVCVNHFLFHWFIFWKMQTKVVSIFNNTIHMKEQVMQIKFKS